MSRTAVSALLALVVAVPLLGAAPAASAAPLPSSLRVSTAPTTVKDASGRRWSAARGFVGGYRVAPVGAPIARTRSDRLYRSQHWGMSRFRAPLARGTYRVTLHLAETYWTGPGQRVFDVAAEGRSVARGVDIARKVGRNAAYPLTTSVVVADGALDLSFTHRVNFASVAGVEAVRTGGVPRTSKRKPAVRPAVPSVPKAAPKPTVVPSPAVPALPTAPAAPASPAVPDPVPTDEQTVPAPVVPGVDPTAAPTTPSPAPAQPVRPRWASGASAGGGSEQQRPDGAFATWRGRELDIAGSWIDNNTAQVEVWSLWPNLEYGQWDRDLDLAVGAISWDETWAEAATGAYDARWRKSLTNIKKRWGAIDRGQLYLRFAHEMNGSWYPWRVFDKDREAFIASWKRYRALQQEILPEAKLVFNVNRESVATGFDWRKSFPGKQYVDVLSVDYYNQWPHADTEQEWDEQILQKDQWGAPKGLELHRRFAESQGLPFSLGEWGNNAEWGESPLFMRKMHEFFRTHAGSGPGQLLYEVYFNPAGAETGKWELFPNTRQPSSSKAYRDVF